MGGNILVATRLAIVALPQLLQLRLVLGVGFGAHGHIMPWDILEGEGEAALLEDGSIPGRPESRVGFA